VQTIVLLCKKCGVNQIFWVVFLSFFFVLPVPITKDWLILLLLILFNPWNLSVQAGVLLVLPPMMLAQHVPNVRLVSTKIKQIKSVVLIARMGTIKTN
jgi:hypothetical protein|tara:strand:- start:335 stop:628 length:294 start_codon:yes stop_codon:yes gene_type:complete